jgi:starch-binding outer membrane protein, SusD/RagB family
MKKIFLTISLLGMLASSCDSYLDKQPLDTPSSTTYLSTEAEINLALTGVYSSTYWNTGNLPSQILLDLYTEIGVERTGGIASGSFDAANGTVSSFWTFAYTTISRANVLLDGMTRAKANTPVATYNRLEAEAKVIRAWGYYHLIGLFGDVPYYTKPLEPSEYYTLERTPKKVIIDAMMADLDDAATKLNWAVPERGRVSRGVALGLKARLALMDGRYKMAADAANAVITGGQYGLNPNFGDLFKKAGQTANVGKEIMYEMLYPDAVANPVTFVGLGQGSRTLAGQSGRFPQQPLVDKFECTDGKRLDQSPLYDPKNPSKNRDSRLKWTVTMHGDTIEATASNTKRKCVFNIYDTNSQIFNYTTGKYALATNADFSNAFGPVKNGMGYLWAKYSYDVDQDFFRSKSGFSYMRYAEILLTYAEAKIEAGEVDASVINAINLVRRRSKMPDVVADVAGNVAKLRQLVRREKTVEFANEGLHLFDIRRWGTGVLVLNTKVYGAAKEAAKPTPTPTFGGTGSAQDLNDIADYAPSDALRFTREARVFTEGKHNLWPIPQRERDINPKITQNVNW